MSESQTKTPDRRSSTIRTPCQTMQNAHSRTALTNTRGWSPIERRLVAQSTESEDPAPALAAVQSHGRGIQLRRRSSRASTWMP